MEHTTIRFPPDFAPHPSFLLFLTPLPSAHLQYPTFSGLAGVSGKDDPPVAPLPVDPSNPTKDIYGAHSFPPVDGVDIWQLLLAGETNRSAAHPVLVLSREVILAGDYKLLVAQNYGWSHASDNGWQLKNSYHFNNTGANSYASYPCAATDASAAQGDLPGVPGLVPCLFDTTMDPSERTNLAAGVTVAQVQAEAEAQVQAEAEAQVQAEAEAQVQAEEAQLQPPAAMVADLWAKLNRTVLSAFCKNITHDNFGPNGCGTSPSALLGTCDSECATKYWKGKYGQSGSGPTCGVPGCNGTQSTD
jgi:hypothetical protein